MLLLKDITYYDLDVIASPSGENYLFGASIGFSMNHYANIAIFAESVCLPNQLPI